MIYGVVGYTEIQQNKCDISVACIISNTRWMSVALIFGGYCNYSYKFLAEHSTKYFVNKAGFNISQTK